MMQNSSVPSDKELKQRLTPEEYHVLREKGTEMPGSGKYTDVDVEGTYRCKVCNSPLFHSANKEDATKSPPGLAGWPSFNDAIPGAIEFKKDNSMGMRRTEVVCATCDSHLGHLFDDAGTANGKHYCINSVCLNLEEQ